MQNQDSYQLTSHPSGSKREFWTLSWPLMLGLLSSTLMLFADRLFLARWSPLGLNAAVSGGIAYFMFLVVPMGVMEIAEVLVGRLHGEKRNKEIGSAAWQMVLLSLALFPVFLLIAFIFPSFLFVGSGNEANETVYFQILIGFAVFQCIAISLSGFFIGLGKVKIVTISAIISNVINICLDYWFIFGGGPLPAMGVLGAALATGIALAVQAFILLWAFWLRHNRQEYGTTNVWINRPFLHEGLRIGLPSGLGRSFEIVAHFLFFKIVMSVGLEQMALVAIAQSIYILFSFITEAQSKTAGAIVSNLLGANQHSTLSQVLRSGFTLVAGYFLVIFVILNVFSEQIYYLFSAQEDVFLQMTPELMATFKRALLGVSFFFLIDSLAWILIGFLTAAKDTRFIFWASLLVNWIAYVPPTIWFIGYKKGGADIAWAIVVGVAIASLAIYLWRYFSGKWLKYDEARQVL